MSPKHPVSEDIKPELKMSTRGKYDEEIENIEPEKISIVTLSGGNEQTPYTLNCINTSMTPNHLKSFTVEHNETIERFILTARKREAYSSLPRKNHV